VTVKEHDACRDRASVAVQLTVVGPKGNDAPEAGVQGVVTGAAPAVTVGLANVTTWDAPVIPLTDTSAGHAICGGSVTGVGGWPGDLPPHAASSTTRLAPHVRSVRRSRGFIGASK